MKLYLSQLNELFVRIKNNTLKGLLLYGPDKGYIYTICQLLEKKYDFILTELTYQGIIPKQLEMLLNSQNFFRKKELIKITSVSNVFNQEIKVVLNTEFLNFVVFIADELSPTAAIRKHFEKEHNLVSIGCYHDDEQATIKFVLKKCQNKTLTSEALDFLKINLKGDHELIKNEINKLLAFVGTNSQINFEDVTKVISSNMLMSYEDLCNGFAEKNLEKFLNELTKMKQQNINEISMIRALINYYLNLYIVLSKEENGEKLDLAIKALTPPIFFKYINNFKSVALRVSTTEVIKILLVLQEAEVKLKLSINHFDFYHEVYMKAHH